ncbi:MAG: right-handed parallel beta-helix repeat-containing protein [Akkermansiaceae bacterium]
MKRFLILLFLLSGWLLAASHSVHVSKLGNDLNNGSKEAPFASFERARDEIRKLKASLTWPAGGVEVWIHEGIYERSETFALGANDGGSLDAPVFYRAVPGDAVSVFSGKQVPTEAWERLSPQAAKRVHPKIKAEQLVELNYDQLGVANGDKLSGSEQSAGAPEAFVLFVDGKRQRISQWPNSDERVVEANDPGWATPNGTRDNFSFFFASGGEPSNKDFTNELDLDGTERSKRWKARLDAGNDLWLRGHWRTPWAPRLSLVRAINLDEKWIQLSQIPPGGMGSKYTRNFTAHDGEDYRMGSGAERYYALNLLEEIDQPGEYAIDFKDRRLYFYPPSDLESLEVTITDSKKPIVKAKDCGHLQFENLTFQGGLDSGLIFEGCDHLVVQGCVIEGVGRDGLVIKGGKKHLIQSNDITEVGHCGMNISNIGDRKGLIHGESLITNNHVSHTGKLHFDSAGIRVDQVIGITFSHNLIHHTPSRAYEHRNDNDVLFEYNEIHNCALKTSDTGATYTHGKWTTYGNVFRYNLIHHNKRANGFYCDDGDSGDIHHHNILHQCIDALKFGGGHDNIAQNNLLIENQQQRIDDRGVSRNYRLGTRYEKDLRSFKPMEEPWRSYGLKLKKEYRLSTELWSDVLAPKWVPELPHGCRYSDNVTVKSSNWRRPKKGNLVIENNVEIGGIEEAGFYNYAKMDLRTKNEVILSKIPKLNEIFLKMGLKKDQYRKAVPSRESVGGLRNFGDTVEGEEDADLDR